MLEYGVESTNDQTLININRGHDYACAVKAIKETASKGIDVAAHLILGLPGEDADTILAHAGIVSKLPLTALKLHQLQLVKGTKMASEYNANPEKFNLYSADEYIDLLVRFIERLNPEIAIERFVSQSPAELLIAPDWGIKNFEFVSRIEKELRKRDTFQGKYFSGK